MKARESAIGSARELAETSRARAQAAMDEFDAKTRAARAEVYRQMDEKRRAALATRAELVAATRGEVERSMEEAAVRLRTQADAARASSNATPTRWPPPSSSACSAEKLRNAAPPGPRRAPLVKCAS